VLSPPVIEHLALVSFSAIMRTLRIGDHVIELDTDPLVLELLSEDRRRQELLANRKRLQELREKHDPDYRTTNEIIEALRAGVKGSPRP
jgi:hypothetical protein